MQLELKQLEGRLKKMQRALDENLTKKAQQEGKAAMLLWGVAPAEVPDYLHAALASQLGLLGVLLEIDNDFAGAEEASRAALGVWAVTPDEAGGPGWCRSVEAETALMLADVLVAQSRLEEALIQINAGISLLEGVVQHDPENTHRLRTLARAIKQRAATLKKQGQVQEASAAHRTSLDLYTRLIALAPESEEIKREMTVVLAALAASEVHPDEKL